MSIMRRALSKPVVKATGKQAVIFPAADLADPKTGQLKYTQKQIAEAIINHAEGHQKKTEGETMMKMQEPIIKEFARVNFARVWSDVGTRPKNPKLTTTPNAEGVFSCVSFQDKQVNVDENAYQQLVEFIGSQEDVDEKIVERDVAYSFNTEILKTELSDLPQVPVTDENGKPVKEKGKNKLRPQTVFDLVDKALTDAFKTRPEIGNALLAAKPLFRTRKGMIDELLDLAGRGQETTPVRLAELMVKANVCMGIKPGNFSDSNNKSDDD